jgi:hypothetical protein
VTAPDGVRRFLRPGVLVVAGPRLWVVDRVQPVAAVLDLATEEQVALVGWPQVPAGPAPEGRVVLAAEDGVWVQQPAGPVVLVGEDGTPSGRYVSDTVLGAVSAHGAWCAPEPRAQDVAATSDAPPSDDRTSSLLRLARADQVTRTVPVDAAVQSVVAVDGDLFVEVETGSWTRRSLGTPTSWDLEPETAWLRLRADQEVPDRLGRTAHASDAPSRADRGRWRYGRLPDLTDPDDRPAEPHARTPGLDWFVGWDGGSATEEDRVVALGLQADGPTELLRLPLGGGSVVAVVASGDQVWVAVEQRPRGSYRPSGPTAVLRIDASTGNVDTVVGPDSVDITALGWPVGPPPVDADDYVAYWQRHLSSLDAYWTDESGHVHPLSDGLSDTRVDVVDAWPGTTLHVTFGWTRRPGVRLRRVVALYDDLGRPDEPLYADIHIMEDLETGHVPAGPAPGARHLDF